MAHLNNPRALNNSANPAGGYTSRGRQPLSSTSPHSRSGGADRVRIEQNRAAYRREQENKEVMAIFTTAVLAFFLIGFGGWFVTKVLANLAAHNVDPTNLQHFCGAC